MIWWWTGWQYLRPLLNTPLADTHALELTKSKSRALEEEMGGVGGGRNTFLYSSFSSPNLCVVLKEIKPWETWQHISHCIPSLIIGKWNVSRWIYGRGLLFSLPEAGPFFLSFYFVFRAPANGSNNMSCQSASHQQVFVQQQQRKKKKELYVCR